MLSVKIETEKLARKIARDLEVAEYRTINVVTEKAKNMLARDVASTEGYSVGTIKRRLVVVKAFRGTSFSQIFVSGTRLGYPGLRAVRRKGKPAGISFYSQKKSVRKVLMEPIDHRGQAGSRPFIITGINSGKPISVFVHPAYLNTKTKRVAGGSHPRKVVTIAGHSLPHIIRADWRERVLDFCRAEMPKELARQHQKASQGR